MSFKIWEKFNEVWAVDQKDPLNLYISLDHQYPLYKASGDKKIKFLLKTGDNRTAKTDWLTTDAVLYLEGRHPFIRTPKRAVYWLCSTDFKKWNEVLYPKFRAKMKPGTYVINNQTGMITITKGLGKGNRCILKSDEQPVVAFEGGRVDRAGVDEEISQTKFNALCVRTTDTGGQVLIAATLINGLTYLYYDFIEPWQKGERKDVLVVITGWAENPVLDEKNVLAVKEQLAREDPLLAAIRFGGQFLSLGGKMVFDGAKIGECMKNTPDTIQKPWEG